MKNFFITLVNMTFFLPQLVFSQVTDNSVVKKRLTNDVYITCLEKNGDHYLEFHAKKDKRKMPCLVRSGMTEKNITCDLSLNVDITKKKDKEYFEITYSSKKKNEKAKIYLSREGWAYDDNGFGRLIIDNETMKLGTCFVTREI